VATTEHVRSSVRTVQLAIQAAADDDAMGPFLARVISQAEDDASSALNGFDAIQPPSETADDLRDEVDQIASDAIDLISTARIAIRRGDTDGLKELAEPITAAGDSLEQFGQDHHV
jgi:phosphate uptake regulator